MMKYLCALILVSLSTPAFGQAMSVFGQSTGSLCYEQSRDGASPRMAAETCTRALNEAMNDTDRAYTHINRSINYNLLGKYDEALSDIDAAFELVPELPEAYLSRGNTYFLQKDHSGAIEEYSTALDLAVSDSHKAYFNRALAYEELKNYEKAYRDFLSSVSERPGYTPALERIALYEELFADESWMSQV